MTLREFQISSDIFGGFTRWVDVMGVNSLDDIVEVVRSALEGVLTDHHLYELRNTLHQRNFHIHDFTIADIRKASSDRIFYVCDHCE